MNNELYFPFEDLDVYKHARALVKSTYILIEKFPYTERNGLSDQLRRAIVSIPSNIAEGLGRISDKEKNIILKYHIVLLWSHYVNCNWHET